MTSSAPRATLSTAYHLDPAPLSLDYGKMNDHYKATLAKVEEELAKTLPELPDAEWWRRVILYDDESVNSDGYRAINAPALELLSRGGKRWRPVLMCLCCQMCGGGDSALPLVPLVELPHNGSLIVDDIEDSSKERRGEIAIHLKYGEDMAINTGTLLYFLPLLILDSIILPVEKKEEVRRIHGRALLNLHYGQGLDIWWHRTSDYLPEAEEYMTMCRLKTGSLAGMGGEVGALMADADGECRVHLGGIMAEMGVAFQIMDDVANLTTGNPGKRRGDDIIEGKKSLPIILFGHNHPQHWKEIASALGREDTDIERVVGMLEDAGTVEEAHSRAEDILVRISTELEAQYADTPARNTVVELIHSFSV